MALGLARQRAGGRRRRTGYPQAGAAFSLTNGITMEYAEVVDA